MTEERLEGGYVDGAVRAGDTVRRLTGPWMPAVHALLAHLAGKGFTGAPRPLGFDEQGREVLTFLEGESVGRRKPRPAWVYAEDTLDQVARWIRDCHQAAGDFVPPPGAIWRGGRTWSPGLIIVHNAARPRRLSRFLRTYGWPGTAAEFLDIAGARITAHADGIRGNAAAGDEASGRLLRQGVPDALDQAIAELASFPR